jgi:hypothetical protein
MYLYLQANSKWVDRRLFTALARRLLNASVAHIRQISKVPPHCGLYKLRLHNRAAAGQLRLAQKRTLLWYLETAQLARFTGTTMYCCRYRC